MYATHYDPKLANTIYQEVYFTISGDQFPEDAELTHEIDGRIHDLDETRLEARSLAKQFNHAVDVAVYGTWGHHGNEYIESFKVEPKPCPISAARDDLADIKAQMFGA